MRIHKSNFFQKIRKNKFQHIIAYDFKTFYHDVNQLCSLVEDINTNLHNITGRVLCDLKKTAISLVYCNILFIINMTGKYESRCNKLYQFAKFRISYFQQLFEIITHKHLFTCEINQQIRRWMTRKGVTYRIADDLIPFYYSNKKNYIPFYQNIS